MSAHPCTIFKYIKENLLKFSQICNYWIFNKGLELEFETAVINELSVFEPLNFYCTLFSIVFQSYQE